MRDSTAQGWIIQFTSGGEIPKYLKGLWTNYEKAQNRVKTYLNNKVK